MPNIDAETLNILKLLQTAEGNGHFATVSQGWIQTSGRDILPKSCCGGYQL